MAAFRHIDKHILKKIAILCAMAVTVVALIFLYGSLDPECGFFPACPFKVATGYDCPGCGSQRAIHAILHGRIADAWSHNALMVMLLPIVTAIIIIELKHNKWRRLHNFILSRYSIIALASIISFWFIARNVH